MKRFSQLTLTVISIFLMFTACNNKDKQNTTDQVSTDLVTNPVSAEGMESKSKLPKMEFKENRKDFGIVIQGEKVAYTFEFTNTGGADLVISDASSTCGCTVADYPKKPIKPGEKGSVQVVFNSSGKTGSQNKSIRFLTNAQPNTIELTITAEVYIPPKK